MTCPAESLQAPMPVATAIQMEIQVVVIRLASVMLCCECTQAIVLPMCFFFFLSLTRAKQVALRSTRQTRTRGTGGSHCTSGCNCCSHSCQEAETQTSHESKEGSGSRSGGVERARDE